MKGLLCRTLEVVRSSWQFYKCAEGVPGLSLSFSLSLSLSLSFSSLHITSQVKGPQVVDPRQGARFPTKWWKQLWGGRWLGLFSPRSERFEACVRRGCALPIHSFSLSLSHSLSVALSLSLSLALSLSLSRSLRSRTVCLCVYVHTVGTYPYQFISVLCQGSHASCQVTAWPFQQGQHHSKLWHLADAWAKNKTT